MKDPYYLGIKMHRAFSAPGIRGHPPRPYLHVEDSKFAGGQHSHLIRKNLCFLQDGEVSGLGRRGQCGRDKREQQQQQQQQGGEEGGRGAAGTGTASCCCCCCYRPGRVSSSHLNATAAPPRHDAKLWMRQETSQTLRQTFPPLPKNCRPHPPPSLKNGSILPRRKSFSFISPPTKQQQNRQEQRLRGDSLRLSSAAVRIRHTLLLTLWQKSSWIPAADGRCKIRAGSPHKVQAQ